MKTTDRITTPEPAHEEQQSRDREQDGRPITEPPPPRGLAASAAGSAQRPSRGRVTDETTTAKPILIDAVPREEAHPLWPCPATTCAEPLQAAHRQRCSGRG